MNHEKCSLHGIRNQYFCEKCYEPICQQCTIMGPHNTPIHLISHMNVAYQRRINEIKQRIGTIINNNFPKNSALLRKMNQNIERLKQLKKATSNQNKSQEMRMLEQLQRTYEYQVHKITLLQEDIWDKTNAINDLGNHFETLTNEVEIIASYANIIAEIKEVTDRLLLFIAIEPAEGELPKELTEIRLKLKQIEAYQELFQQKIAMISNILIDLENKRKEITPLDIDFQTLIKQLDQNVKQNIEHSVCHFCNIPFNFQSSNTICLQNSSSLKINEFIGFCAIKPDSSKWSTKRHYFYSAKDPLSHFPTYTNSSYAIHLSTLLLKLKAICFMKKLDLKQQISKNNKCQQGICEKIVLVYLLQEQCGLSEEQTQIVMTLCKEHSKKQVEYQQILAEIDKIVF